MAPSATVGWLPHMSRSGLIRWPVVATGLVTDLDLARPPRRAISLRARLPTIEETVPDENRSYTRGGWRWRWPPATPTRSERGGATYIGRIFVMAFDPEEMVELYRQGTMTLRTAVERVTAQKLQGLRATIFRDGEPTILDLPQIEQLAAMWGMV